MSTQFLLPPIPLDNLNGVFPYIFKHMDAAVVVADSNRRIIMINDEARNLFGYEEFELVGQETRLVYADPADFEEQGRKRFNKKAAENRESYVTRYRRKNGDVFHGETIGGPIKNGEDENLFFVAFIKDVSERVATEKALNQLHAITSSREQSLKQRIEAILELGTEHFGLPIGIVSQIDGPLYEVAYAVHPENTLQSGTVFDFRDTYCSHVFGSTDVSGFHHVGESEIRTHPCYENFKLEAYLGSTIFVNDKRFGTLNFSSPESRKPFTQQNIEMVRLLAQWIGHELSLAQELKSLEQAREDLGRMTAHDELTGLFNRRYGVEQIEKELDRLRRYQLPLVVAVLSFDHLHVLNDQYGYTEGDRALRSFAQQVAMRARSTDVIARWGGSEFLAVLPNTDEHGARAFLERLIENVTTAQFSTICEKVDLTMSVGVALAGIEDSVDQLVKRADGAMRESRASGQSQISVHHVVGAGQATPKT